uniref:C2H2-type domain-containing protein n=1 Tax=Glossina austeni TaxID=7395 RepID=A0A1A9ULP7_GLOAU
MEQSRPAYTVTGGAREETVCPSNNATDADSTPKSSAKRRSSIMRSTNRSNTATGSDSENSNDSWTTKEYSTKFIMRYGREYSKSKNGKPFVCPVPGCEKRYKTINGIRYHAKKGHREKVRKRFMCSCGKCYKDAQGLKSHAFMIHKSSPKNVLDEYEFLGFESEDSNDSWTTEGYSYNNIDNSRVKVRKRFMCSCGKCYKDAHRLESHALMIHNSSPKNVLAIPKVSGPVEGAEFTLDDMPSCSSVCLGRIVTTAAVHREPLTTIAGGANRRRRRRSSSCSTEDGDTS